MNFIPWKKCYKERMISSQNGFLMIQLIVIIFAKRRGSKEILSQHLKMQKKIRQKYSKCIMTIKNRFVHEYLTEFLLLIVGRKKMSFAFPLSHLLKSYTAI